MQAALTTDFTHRGDRPTYFPARLTKADNGTYHAELLRWHGSADLASLTGADALVVFPAGDALYNQGEVVETLLL